MGGKNWNQTELIITISNNWLLYLADNRGSRTSPNYFAFCFEIPPSTCLSVLPLPPLPIPMFYQVSIPIPCTVTMAIPGLWRHSAVVQCLCPFLIFILSFSLLCLADYEWIKQLCVNLQSSFDFYIFYICNVFFFGCLFIFLQLISF